MAPDLARLRRSQRARLRREDVEALTATALRKKFPRPDLVVYNERFPLGSCTDAIRVAPLPRQQHRRRVDPSTNRLGTSKNVNQLRRSSHSENMSSMSDCRRSDDNLT